MTKQRNSQDQDTDTIEFTCPKCRSELRVPSEHQDKLARCPSCGSRVRIPEA